ncbi:hypothetical protein D3C87_482440 [compost metagenome]
MFPIYMCLMKVTRKSDGETHTMTFDMEYTAQGTFDRLNAANPGVYECEITPMRGSYYYCPELFEQEFAIRDLEKNRNATR